MIEKFTNIKDMLEYPSKGVLSKHIKKTSGMDITLFSMAADTEIGDHTSTKEGSVYVIEGKGTFVLEGEEIEMVPGVMIYMDKNAVHSLKAEENTSFILTLSG
ncbi:MAG: cupin domain-containing protein [Candidatus Aenigmarchaeota archaeon]|nr:cupin domain-containing protein [Candidatus Aenigmarchaeota archaeon]